MLRALAGLSAALYDPGRHGYLTDATPGRARRGVRAVRGSQMGGLLLGPAIGAFGAANFGGIAFMFVFSAIAASCRPRHRDPRQRDARSDPPAPPPDATGSSGTRPPARRPPSTSMPTARERGPTTREPVNHGLIAAIVINAGGYCAAARTRSSGACSSSVSTTGLDLIGLTFAMFGLPVLLLSPIATELDRRGTYRSSSRLHDPRRSHGPRVHADRRPSIAVPLILLEATRFPFLNPALYAVVAANSPAGRSSTAQGLLGAAGTVGFIVASLIAGVLATRTSCYPFYVFAVVLTMSLVVAPDRRARHGPRRPGRGRRVSGRSRDGTRSPRGSPRPRCPRWSATR